MKYGSLFAGIGGMDLGLDRAGMQCAWQVEIDPYARKVLTKHWPEVPKYEDVRTVGRHNLASVDLIAGGFPCQDISNAGKRAGIEGERSRLWSEFHRIICELRPRYVLVENVAALLVRGIDRVLGDLAACGYDAEWQCISAASVGAPHRRDRLFIVAYTAHSNDSPCCNTQGRPSLQSGGSRRREDGRPCVSRDFSLPFQSRLEGDERIFMANARQRRQYANTTRPSWWAIEPDVDRVANGIPARVDRLKGLGNAVVPQVAEYIGREIMRHSQKAA